MEREEYAENPEDHFGLYSCLCMSLVFLRTSSVLFVANFLL